MVGCGGFVRELITYTSGATSVKDSSGQRLSAADLLVDRLLREQLLALVPGSCGYSEESGAFGRMGPGPQVHWLVDPVDGTRPAVLGGAFAVSVGALVVEEEHPTAALGWVYVPTLSTLYRGVLSEERTECLLNGRPVQAESGLTAEALANRYIAVSSDWRPDRLPRCPMKLSAPGATAVHLAQLVHPGSDVAAAALTRYRPHDAAAGLVVAVAGGGAIYRLDSQPSAPGPEPPLSFLLGIHENPEGYAPAALVCTPEVNKALK